jgi:hypothetical protein
MGRDPWPGRLAVTNFLNRVRLGDAAASFEIVNGRAVQVCNLGVASAPHFRFYAGAPVHDPDGFALGSICVIDFRPRKLDGSQRRTLLELAAIASDEVKLRELMAKL